MPLDYEELRTAQLRTKRLFWIEAYIDELFALLSIRRTAATMEAYKWGRQHYQGSALHLDTAEQYDLSLFVSETPPASFRSLIERIGPQVRVDVIVTGTFGFSASINLSGKPSGAITLFLTDGSMNFALTCSHVLNAAPMGRRVYPGGSRSFGTLRHRIDLSTALPVINPARPGDPDEPNEVDCAIAELDNPPGPNQAPGGPRISVIKQAAARQNVRVLNGRGVAYSIHAANSADLRVAVRGAFCYFNDLTSIEGNSARGRIQPGDSGSLIVSDAHPEQALAMSIATSASVGGGPEIAVACDLRKTLTAMHRANAAFPAFSNLRLT